MRETIGGYRILGEIGSGGFGAVYRARDPLSDQDVALKTLTQITNPNDLERFRREARLAYGIGDPNIIRILHYGEDGGDNFIVMELMPLSLRDALASGGLPISRSVDICRQAALGLQAAHERGVIHRDIKPGNILLDSEGAVKIADFGIAHAEDLPNLTRTGIGIGTGRYMSREQFIDSKRVDARADIYSLGVTLYEMLTGSPPYDSRQSAKSARASIPDDLERIINRCRAVDRERRYQTMDELIQAIANPALVNRCALTDFYEATGGPNWERSDNWLTDAPLSEWHGVTASSDGVVTKLISGQNNLEGKIPPEISHLTELRYLSLWGNRLSGSMPPELGSLTELDGLVLWGNRLSGSIPPEMGNLAKLKSLNLSDNRLSGSIPPELGNLAKLEWLDLSDNRLSGSIPPELGKLAKLEWLGLSDNRLSGSVPPELGNLAKLEWLDLSYNRLSGSIPPELGNLTKLVWVDLSGGNNWDCVPKSLLDALDALEIDPFELRDLPICGDC